MEQRSFALKLEYDGTAYGGSQFQANARSIQNEVERALAPMTLAAERTRVAFAGRTDAGVHATGQVAVVRVPAKWTPEKLRRALNARLPEDIAVLAVVETAAGFDPRRCARRRRYEYRVLNGPVHSPLMRQSVWHVRHPLDDEKLRAAGALLVGKHDFAAFGGPVDPPGASTVREMFATSVARNGFGLTLSFEANAFLPHQVRRMVGALVETGRGRLTVEAFEMLLRQACPGSAGPAAPARGLCLVGVTYEDVRFEMGEDG